MTHTIDYEAMAKEAAGNWQHFDCFCWYGQPPEPDEWCIVYTSNRDSRLRAQSNADAIAKEMEPFLGKTAIAETHSHWACGSVYGYSIRVYGKRGITKAFRKWCDLQDAMNNYVVLDEEDYSRREHEATLENIEEVAGQIDRKSWCGIEFPEGYSKTLFDWFWENDQSAIENTDDSGGYPSEESMTKALIALGWYKPEEYQ
jgi:hypothetical protein